MPRIRQVIIVGVRDLCRETDGQWQVAIDDIGARGVDLWSFQLAGLHDAADFATYLHVVQGAIDASSDEHNL